MAAEDYFPTSPGDSSDTDFEEGGVGYGSQGFDREWDAEHASPRLVTCKRCGAPSLHWKMQPGGWRLFSAGILHTCVRPNKIHPVNLPSLLTTPTLSAYQPKEPIMDKNAVAFIRNDVSSIHVVFPDPSMASGFSKEYHYLTTDSDIAPDDWVVVNVNGMLKCAKVTATPHELQIEPNSSITYKFIVGKVDTTQYNLLLESNSKIEEMLKTSYRTTLREGFRQTLLAGLDAEKQASLSIILSASPKE